MERFICVHGHFYQPPRENPWLEEIEFQDSAYPFHDWNERIDAECYSANARARILDSEQRLSAIVNNYARISFNFGPTLLSWMQAKSPAAYRAVLDADKESQRLFGGHGSALAQAYSHMILPLAEERDIETQVIWGIRDFESRFGRFPEGMWLPETAVDLRSLEALAEQGIRFTILAPHQARRVRKIGGRAWLDLEGASIDPSRPYLLRLPSGRSISLFFYDGPISRAVAFERLLETGEGFAGRLMSGFTHTREAAQLMHIATDGETYGHHHRHGEMALAYALRHIEENALARLTNYGQHLEAHPPEHEVQIHENTAWSCAHGVERWRSDCGCNSGGRPGWNQGWRGPLRESLDWLRDTVAPLYEIWARSYLRDPWAARNDYIGVILDRSPANLDRYFERHAVRALGPNERSTAMKLLELQRHAQLMYTSCGWFFDDLSGIETVQVIQYAGRVAQLAREIFGDHIEDHFLERLAQAKSNVPEFGDGRALYERWVRPAMVDLFKVGGHFAMRSLFDPPKTRNEIACYAVEVAELRLTEAGRANMVVGRGRASSRITLESAEISFCAAHLGDQNLHAGVRPFRGEQAFGELMKELPAVFERADYADVIRLMDVHFGGRTYSLRSLFRDEQRVVMNRILDETRGEVEREIGQLHKRHLPLIRFLADLGMPQPRAFRMVAEFSVNQTLRAELAKESLDARKIRALLADAAQEKIKIEAEEMAHAFRGTLARLAASFLHSPDSFPLLERIETAIGLAPVLPFEVDFWPLQHAYYETMRATLPRVEERARNGDDAAQDWCSRFTLLGEGLKVRLA